ncbi:hypothetical protein PV327_000261 [Microctonus hyperodae]|uniref:Uncharacterized protein n=1 Tax=Microctonus hyperodae TaxID=165561 RepID=A0AA39G5W3_MICHY|nr:hypothetical protein PV327_000261 [Microctonus hyperodae]
MPCVLLHNLISVPDWRYCVADTRHDEITTNVQETYYHTLDILMATNNGEINHHIMGVDNCYRFIQKWLKLMTNMVCNAVVKDLNRTFRLEIQKPALLIRLM